jgi:hypothetical protein
MSERLPPAPAAVTEYFRRRRGSLAELTTADLQHNERLWVVETCGLPESACDPAITPGGSVPRPAAWEVKYGGSTEPEVVPAVHADTTHCGACARAFQPRREWSRYCSPICKQRAKRARRTAA